MAVCLPATSCTGTKRVSLTPGTLSMGNAPPCPAHLQCTMPLCCLACPCRFISGFMLVPYFIHACFCTFLLSLKVVSLSYASSCQKRPPAQFASPVSQIGACFRIPTVDVTCVAGAEYRTVSKFFIVLPHVNLGRSMSSIVASKSSLLMDSVLRSAAKLYEVI